MVYRDVSCILRGIEKVLSFFSFILNLAELEAILGLKKLLGCFEVWLYVNGLSHWWGH